MVFKTKIAVIVLTLSFVGGPLVYTAYATDWFAAMKFGLDIAAKAVAQGAFRTLSQRVFNKIEGGGINGGALFVQDWREFQLNSQYRGEDVFRSVLKKSKLCGYFGNELEKLFDANKAPDIPQILTRVDGFDSFQVKTGCTMPSNFNMTNYQKDFAGNGGWEAWNRLLEPQNNFYGTLFMSLDEAAKQRGIESSAAVNEALSGEGFTGVRDCLTKGTGASACALLGKIKTPGGTLGKQVSSVFDSNLKFYTTADAASIAIATFTEFFINKLLDQGFDTKKSTYKSGDSGDNTGPGFDREEIENTYKNEFCTVGDNLSTVPTARYIFNNHIAAYRMFPPEEALGSTKATDDNDVGKSYCKWAYDKDDNKDPYTRCIRACYQKLGLAPGNNLIGPTYISPTGAWWDDGGAPGGGEEEGPPAPADAKTKHGDHTAEVQAAKDELIAEGKKFPDPNATNECYRFEIVKRAAPKIDGAGFLSKPGGNNCNGFSVDIIAFPDGYIYDVIGDDSSSGGDGSKPSWHATGCGPITGNGTCPERYRAP